MIPKKFICIVRKSKTKILSAILVLAVGLSGCGQNIGSGSDKEQAGEAIVNESSRESAKAEENSELPFLDDLHYTDSMEISYAEGFSVDYYEEGYKLIRIGKEDVFLWIPEGKEAPANTDGCTLLYAPLDHIYLAATSSMSLVNALGCIDAVTMTGTEASGWYIDAPKQAIEEGRMIFAGKYSSPDYEMLIGNSCDLAIESTMIYHTPEVKEMLEDLEIPVLVDQSSYEKSGLGRTEWIKLYGALMDCEEEAEEYFAEQAKIMDEVAEYEASGKTVAYFSVNSDGSCVVRSPEDYIAEMIGDAGGEYVFEDLDTAGSSSATLTISMEEFYSKAVDCDYLVYNSTIEGGLQDVDALIEKNALFSDFAAVRNDHVWQVDRSMYQSTDQLLELIRDFHSMLQDQDAKELTFLKKLTS